MNTRIRLSFLVFLSLMVGACAQHKEKTITEIQTAVEHLADESIPINDARIEIENSIFKAFDSYDDDTAREYMYESMKRFKENGGEIQKLISRSSQFEPCVLDPEQIAQRCEALGYKIQLASKRTPRGSHAVRSLEAAAEPKNLVVHINGILTDYSSYTANVMVLEKAAQELPGDYNITTKGIFNPTGGAVLDLAECNVHKVMELIGQYAAIAKIDGVADSIYYKMIALASGYDNIILIPHSQGNFYAQEALRKLSLDNRIDYNVIELGSPASGYPSGLRNRCRISVVGDLVALLSQNCPHDIMAPYEVSGLKILSAFIKIFLDGPSLADFSKFISWTVETTGEVLQVSVESIFAAHDFTGSYMHGQAREIIINQIKDYSLTRSSGSGTTTTTTSTTSINPTIAMSPMSAPGGTTFVEWGTGFTPNSTATLYFPKYDGVNDSSSQVAIDSIGHFEINYPSGTNKPPGNYSWYAIDGLTNKQSNTVTFIITVNPTIAMSPMSGPSGTVFTEWGTGFTPNSTATLYFPKYDGVNDSSLQVAIDSIGHFEITYPSGTNKPPGSYSWYAIDGLTNKNSNTVTYTIINPLYWYTSRAEAAAAAAAEGKLILLIAGRDTCYNTTYMRSVCELASPPLKTLIEEHFVPWYCDVDYSSEWYAYAAGLGSFTLPLICCINPTDINTFLDRTTNIQTPEAFFARLQNVAGVE